MSCLTLVATPDPDPTPAAQSLGNRLLDVDGDIRRLADPREILVYDARLDEWLMIMPS